MNVILSKYYHQKALFQQTESLDDDWIKNKISAYFDFKMVKVNRLKNDIIDDHSLHKIRIHLRMVADVLWYFKKLKLKKN